MMRRMLSLGRVRRAVHPLFVKYWLRKRSSISVNTRVEGFDLEVFPMVFHPRYFGSSAILGRFISSLPLKGCSFLDVGCGSGLIGMCAARAGARVVAIDINAEAVRCTVVNAEKHKLSISVQQSDLFSSIGPRQFDAIAFNPPFFLGRAQSTADQAFYGGWGFYVGWEILAGGRGQHVPRG